MTFKVTLMPSGKCFASDADMSILDAAKHAKINLPHSCRDGSCGTCKSRVVSGNVNQPADLSGITVDEVGKGCFLSCVAKPLSDIVIESSYCPELDGIESARYPCKVSDIEFITSGIAVLTLRLSPGSKFKFLPGQYIDLTWKEVRRSYSIANTDTRENGIELHIRRIPEGRFSDLVFEKLKVGALLHLHGPHGTFFVRDRTAPVIFLAGGTGFAPVKAMVEHLLEQKTHRMIHIYWGVSSIDGLYSTIPEYWQKKYENVVYTPVLSSMDVKWEGRQGLVHKSVLQDFEDMSEFEVYACGSVDMIGVARKDFLKQGLADNNFFADAFTPHNPVEQ